MNMNPALLKIQLLCSGLRAEEDIYRGREGGAGVPGCRTIIMPDGKPADVPMRGHFVAKSRLVLKSENNKWFVYKNGEKVFETSFVPSPNFYDRLTSDAIPMRKLMLLHGTDCVATTVNRYCYLWRVGRQCRFCSIQLKITEHNGRSLAVKTPKQIREVLEAAVKEGVAKHVTLTTGSQDTRGGGAELYYEILKEVRKSVSIAMHAQLPPPDDLKFLELLKDVGLDTVGIHLDLADSAVASHVAPAKCSEDFGRYLDAWRSSVELFGEGQVNSFLLIGFEQSLKAFEKIFDTIIPLGVVPYPIPFIPIPGTPLETHDPPSVDEVVSVFRLWRDRMKAYGLDVSKSKAGCVRCGSCSAVQEVYSYGV